ncbi:MOSC domain-containing protein [Ancylobacter dichloromethanicus]|uniref:Molybdenum cofactor sulfurase n=1 Tax=Ancylobacter dichloromethanicus TaxID=518825 RepID=A0A9W6J4Z8_9HYPH|nr:MOSC domain-containing protein [Ancylobacter dichloromethanicus]MBS7553888.1 MOSC domain-containing protein [Ancylobacter dichloromethanicus]GLK70995.1 molybdenum cofactor sulfurase [Ancylobacter dichloromethanicus]
MNAADEGPARDLFGAPAAIPARRLGARLARTLIADGPGFATREVAELALTLEGIAGDRHAGFARAADSRVPWYPRGTPIRNARQVSLVAPDELAEIARRLGLAELRPEWIGANLLIEGVPRLTGLPPGTRLHFPGGAALVVEGENAPCRHAGAAIAAQTGQGGAELGFAQRAKGLRGLVAWVERAGTLATGAALEVRVPEQRIWTP